LSGGFIRRFILPSFFKNIIIGASFLGILGILLEKIDILVVHSVFFTSICQLPQPSNLIDLIIIL
jgi:hypothetical protein